MIRLGRVSSLSMAPLFHRLEAEIHEVRAGPAELIAALMDGQVAVAPISSIEWARNARELLLFRRLCVSYEGAAGSIQLVTEIPFRDVRSVAVTPESTTSVVLVKVLLPEAEHVGPDEDADAKLLTEDAALRSALEDPTPHYDLGRVWLERTSLPMVVAVWACPDPPPAEALELEEALVESVKRARLDAVAVAEQAAAEYGYPAGWVARYFEQLRYSFGPRERNGLRRFLELAREAGELDVVPGLRFVDDPVPA
jgi:chorismate dehydratase